MKPNVLPFIREKWAGVPQPTASFADKTIIVTGANVGLGLEAAEKFVTLNASTVILAVRTPSKGETARLHIETRTHKPDVLRVWPLDMSDPASIRRFAERASRELRRVDVVVLNAGVSPKDYTVSPDGWEETLQVNVLGTALLGMLLLPKLRASRAQDPQAGGLSHLVVVTSEAHRWLGAADLPDTTGFGGELVRACGAKPADARKWDGMLQNARSKLFAMYVTQGLAEMARSPTTGEVEVVVVSVCPGACRSDLTRHFEAAGVGYWVALKIFDLLFNKTAEQGARVYVAASVVGEEGHGGWYKTTALTSPGDLVTTAKGQQLQRQVWGEIKEALKQWTPS